MKQRLALCVIVGGAVSVGCSVPDIDPHSVVPAEHSRTVLDGSDPTPEPPASRYRLAYDSFYWNCVAVKAQDKTARCPSVCSGTPAASAGCSDGAADSDRVIGDLVRRLGDEDARRALASRVSLPDAAKSLRRYFPAGPQPEGR
jgi:hypothetical protein